MNTQATDSSAKHGSGDGWQQRLRMPSQRVIAWAKDNPDRMLTLSSESGKMRLYAWEQAANRRQILPEAAKFGYTWLSPSGDTIYYMQDTNDSEIGHLMQMAWMGDTGEPLAVNLPPMYFYGLEVGRDDTLYFAGSGQGSFRIYRLDSGNKEARILYEHKNEAYLPFLSADEQLLAFSTSERANNRHWQATVIDARTGQRVAQLSDGDEFAVNPGRFLMASADLRPWSPVPGDQCLLITSNAGGMPKPGIWNPVSGERTDLATDLPGEVVPVGWTHGADRIIVQQTYDARTWLYRYDLDSATLEPLPHSPGTLIPLPPFPDGSVWYTYTSMTEPVQTRALQAGQESIILPPATEGSDQHWKIVHYTSVDGCEIQGFLGIPSGEPPFPAILYLHGGPTGQIGDAYVASWQQLVDAGYLFFTINFHGSTGFGREFQEKVNGNPGFWELQDMATARDYLLSRGLIEPDRIMLTGASYGGYLTLMGLTRQPELWSAGFATVPLCNFLTMYEDANQRLKGWARMLLGGTPDERAEAYWNCSPIAQIDRLVAPVAIIAHRSDTRCPLRQVEEFLARLDELGRPYQAEISEGGHGSRNTAELIHQHEQLLAFADEHIGNRGAVSPLTTT